MFLVTGASLTLIAVGAFASPLNPWDGTWAGLLNKSEPVSVTVVSGKVVGYTIRGLVPIAIESSSVTENKISLRIGADYHINITKTREGAAYGVARGPLGSGTASLLRQ